MRNRSNLHVKRTRAIRFFVCVCVRALRHIHRLLAARYANCTLCMYSPACGAAGIATHIRHTHSLNMNECQNGVELNGHCDLCVDDDDIDIIWALATSYKSFTDSLLGHVLVMPV